jgi:hypothetical protein
MRQKATEHEARMHRPISLAKRQFSPSFLFI